jgi:hypothetical protein
VTTASGTSGGLERRSPGGDRHRRATQPEPEHVARDSLVGQVLAAQTVENDRDARKGKKKTTTEHETVNERPPFPVGDVHLSVLSRRAKKETCLQLRDQFDAFRRE